MSSKSILVICGSLRQHSFNRAVANTLPELSPPGLSFVDAPAIDAIPHYNADDQGAAGFPPAVTALAEAIAAADGVVIVTPEYNFSVPGTLKNALDWLSRLPDFPLRTKPVLIQSASTSMLGGARMQYHLRQILVFLEADTMTKPEVFITLAKDKIDPQSQRLVDQTSRDMITTQLTAFAAYIDRVSPNSNKAG